jgi:putative hemolysin
MSLALEIAAIVFLLILNGWFAMSELAIVSSRPARLAALASEGSNGARVALELAENPARFLSSVQVGITLVGILAGAVSGATLADKLGAWIATESPALGRGSHAIAIALVVGAITYASLIVGELVPKQIALANREAVAARVARPMAAVARFASPLLWMLELSSRTVLKLLRIHKSDGQAVTEEEVRAMIAEGTEAGVFAPQEKDLMAGVMRFGDRKARAVMTPHREMVSIDLAWDPERIIRTLRESRHTRYPVYRDDPNDIIGVVEAKDLLDMQLDGRAFDPNQAVRSLEVVPDSAPAVRVLEVLRRSPIRMVLVIDEYGSVEGIVTATDILSVIAGSFREHGADEEATVVRRDDGSWLVDGDLPVDVAAEQIGCRKMTEDGTYATVAGFILAKARRVPSAGDHFEWEGWRFEVVDMDGRRIDKILVSRTPPDEPVEILD